MSCSSFPKTLFLELVDMISPDLLVRVTSNLEEISSKTSLSPELRIFKNIDFYYFFNMLKT